MMSVAHNEPPKLGQMMVAAGVLDDASLHHLLSLQSDAHTPKFGELAMRHAGVCAQHVHTMLAQQYGVHYVDVSAQMPHPQLLKRRDIAHYMQQRYIPWMRDDDGVLVLASCDVSEARIAELESLVGEAVRVVMTTPRDVLHCLEQQFSGYLSRLARVRLHAVSPLYSAFRRRNKGLSVFWIVVVCSVLVIGALAHHALLMVSAVWLSCIVYVLAMGFKAVLLVMGSRAPIDHYRLSITSVGARCDDAALPVYSVLVPLYHEAENVESLLSALNALDYPRDKLDIKLIVEASDAPTHEALLRVRPASMYEIVVVPDTLPRTKPKACNYALSLARGEYVVIYDAEDRPDAQQLRLAVAAFAHAPQEVVCLQAKLGYYNRDDNMLTRWFSLEYAQLFALLLQGLCRLRMPIPLGGTSNHFRMKVLRQMGEWDAYNVTEDADLGIRLARSGYRSAVLDSWTWEEAPNRLGVWLKQRSRWIKGYMQTWGVHMRRPAQLWRGLGGGGFVGFQLFFALSTLVYVVSPWLWAMACWVVWRDGAELFAQEMFSWRGIGCALVLVCGALVQWWGAWLAMHHAAWCRHGRRAQQWRMWCAVATYPLYGWLHACASMLAIWQFMVKPYYWEKTPHGLYKRAKMK